MYSMKCAYLHWSLLAMWLRNIELFVLVYLTTRLKNMSLQRYPPCDMPNNNITRHFCLLAAHRILYRTLTQQPPPPRDLVYYFKTFYSAWYVIDPPEAYVNIDPVEVLIVVADPSIYSWRRITPPPLFVPHFSSPVFLDIPFCVRRLHLFD